MFALPPVTIGPGQAIAPIVFEAAEDGQDYGWDPSPWSASAVSAIGKRSSNTSPDASPLGPDLERDGLGRRHDLAPSPANAANVAPARLIHGFRHGRPRRAGAALTHVPGPRRWLSRRVASSI